MTSLSGHTYLFSLFPDFTSLHDNFSCHLAHRRPTVLYELFFFLENEHLNFRTPKVNKTVLMDGRSFEFLSRGRFDVDYLTVEHDVGLDFDPEMILIGQNLETSISGLRRNNYTIAKLKSSREMDEKRVKIQDLGQQNYMASVQFERPFDYR